MLGDGYGMILNEGNKILSNIGENNIEINNEINTKNNNNNNNENKGNTLFKAIQNIKILPQISNILNINLFDLSNNINKSFSRNFNQNFSSNFIPNFTLKNITSWISKLKTKDIHYHLSVQRLVVDRKVARLMSDYWVTFATYYDPNGQPGNNGYEGETRLVCDFISDFMLITI